jgi:hypothetical protein
LLIAFGESFGMAFDDLYLYSHNLAYGGKIWDGLGQIYHYNSAM